MTRVLALSASIADSGDVPPDPPEVIVAVSGRRSYSLQNSIAKVNPVQFERSGTVATGALPKRFVNGGQTPLVVQRVQTAVGTAPTGAALAVDVKINGTSVFNAAGDRASIAASQTRGEAVPTKTGDDIVLKPGQHLTVEVTQVGSTVAGSDLSVQVTLG